MDQTTPVVQPAGGRYRAEQPDLQLRSEAVQDLISRVPAWPVRAGSTVVFVVLMLLLLTSWYVRYPDRIEARVTLTTKAMPVRVVAERDGRLQRIFVGEKALVEQGTPLALIENPAIYEDMLALMRWIARADSGLRVSKRAPDLPALPQGLSLGMVQDSYVALQQRLADHRSFEHEAYYAQKRETLLRQREEYEQLGATLEDQEALALEKLALARSQFERKETLYRRQILASEELERAKAELLQTQHEHKDAEQARTSNQIRLAELEGTLVELDRQRVEQERTRRLAVQEAFEKLSGQVAVWRQDYLLEAPRAGQVTFFTPLQETQYVQASEAVLAVVPAAGEVFGQVLLPQWGAGRVQVGQRVRILLDGYPATEFGTVEGVVEDISLVVQDQSYLIRVALPAGLQTSYHMTPAFRQEMEGQAIFTTENVRLLARIFNRLRHAFDQNVAA